MSTVGLPMMSARSTDSSLARTFRSDKRSIKLEWTKREREREREREEEERGRGREKERGRGRERKKREGEWDDIDIK